MPENPLLPHAELRALLAQIKRCTALEAALTRKAEGQKLRRTAICHSGREAVLAATSLQLGPGDLLVAAPGDLLANELAPASLGTAEPRTTLVPDEYNKGVSRLLLAAAMAAAVKEARTDRIVLAFTKSGTPDSSWQSALVWSQQRLLPLLLVCTDTSGPSVFTQEAQPSPTRLQWGAVARLAAKQKLPILTVDGEDAVAMYRTAQEAILRARSGGGPAILWAALPSSVDLGNRSRALRPVNRLAQYLRTRKIPLT